LGGGERGHGHARMIACPAAGGEPAPSAPSTPRVVAAWLATARGGSCAVHAPTVSLSRAGSPAAARGGVRSSTALRSAATSATTPAPRKTAEYPSVSATRSSLAVAPNAAPT